MIPDSDYPDWTEIRNDMLITPKITGMLNLSVLKYQLLAYRELTEHEDLYGSATLILEDIGD